MIPVSPLRNTDKHQASRIYTYKLDCTKCVIIFLDAWISHIIDDVLIDFLVTIQTTYVVKVGCNIKTMVAYLCHQIRCLFTPYKVIDVFFVEDV